MTASQTLGDKLCVSHLVVLARVQSFSGKILQRKISYLQERSPANWTFVKGDSTVAAQVVPVVTKHDGWHHVLHADGAFQFLQKPTVKFLC
jgi:hypothetical protein